VVENKQLALTSAQLMYPVESWTFLIVIAFGFLLEPISKSLFDLFRLLVVVPLQTGIQSFLGFLDARFCEHDGFFMRNQF